MSHAAMQSLIRDVARSERSNFYAAVWRGETEFSKLPMISREHLVRTPLPERRYKEEKSLVKIVRDGGAAFLSEWCFEDIACEAYGARSKRPMVFMTDAHEAIEKAMWCYERNMLPLMGEKDADVAAFTAARYKIDSLITDEKALEIFAPRIEGFSEPVLDISIIGSSFDGAALMRFAHLAPRIRLVLALPETGAFAESPLSESPRFSASDGCVVETAEDVLVVSKTRMLATPIVRYRTAIPSHMYGAQ